MNNKTEKILEGLQQPTWQQGHTGNKNCNFDREYREMDKTKLISPKDWNLISAVGYRKNKLIKLIKNIYEKVFTNKKY